MSWMQYSEKKDAALQEIREGGIREMEVRSGDDAVIKRLGFTVERVYRDDDYAYIVVRFAADQRQVCHVRLPLLDRTGQINHYGRTGHLLDAFINTRSYLQHERLVTQAEDYYVVDAADMFGT